VAVFWPASGLAAGVGILAGRRAYPALAIGVVLGTVAANLLGDRNVWTSLFSGFCNAGEAVLASWLLELWFGRPFAFNNLRRIAGFLAAAGLATAASAIGGAATITLFHSDTAFWEAWRAWFLSDGMGIVVFAPLMIGVGQLWREPLSQRELIEGLGVLALLTLVVAYVETYPTGSWMSFSPGILVLPLLLWLAARCPPAFAIASVFIVSIAVLLAMIFGVGRFGDVAVPITQRVMGAQAAITTGTVFTLVLVALFDDRRQAAMSVQRSEARLAGILKIAGDAIVSTDAQRRIVLYNEAAEWLFGYSQGEALGQPVDLLIPARFHHAHQTHMERFAGGLDTSRRVSEEVIGRRKNGEEFAAEASISKLELNGERYYTVVLRDVTERKSAEKRQGLLIAELDHRVKNTLAYVTAIVQQSGESSSSKDEFVALLEGRIRSLANTHASLSRSRWQGVSVAELVRAELAPCMKDGNTLIEGPDVTLLAEAAQPVAIVLHELTTNAVKYGALSCRQGKVSVRWDWQANGGSDRGLTFEWRERDGPAVELPSAFGHGTVVIREVIPYELGGSVDYVFAPEGVNFKLEIPSRWLGNGTPAALPDRMRHGAEAATGAGKHKAPNSSS
jgi:PAS domain S-box-containing protein